MILIGVEHWMHTSCILDWYRGILLKKNKWDNYGYVRGDYGN